MKVSAPSLEDFCKAYDRGLTQFFSTVHIDDLTTPVACYLRLALNKDYSFLLESVEGGDQLGRYSIVGFDPKHVWQLKKGKAYRKTFAAEGGAKDGLDFIEDNKDALASLRDFIKLPLASVASDLPAQAGAVFGYLGYNSISLIEPKVPDTLKDPLGLPDGCYMLPQSLAIFDRVKANITLVRLAVPQKEIPAKQAWLNATAQLEELDEQLAAALPDLSFVDKDFPEPAAPESSVSPQDYTKMVKAARDYIEAGDIYQVVLGLGFSMDFPLPPFFLYRTLRRTNPSPFLIFMQFEGFSLIGSSPEIMVRLRKDRITIRPLAGTRPRGKTSEEDRKLEQELLADEKERAEHLMLLDLGRNDVGRASEAGTVEVVSSYDIERYSHVMHISSTVEGKFAESMDAVDAVIAGLPAGTVSGAPKIRAMQIIDELEADRRGIYAGTLGYFDRFGELDTCILLRSSVYKDGKLFFRAGAGIVADSKADDEYQECLQKTRAIVDACKQAIALSRYNAQVQKRKSNA